MHTKQSLAVITVLGRVLDVGIDPRRLAVARRRRTPACRSARDFADLVAELGREHHITFLRREVSGSELSALIDTLTAPLVVIGTEGEGEFRPLVVMSAIGDRLRAVEIDGEATERERDISRAAVLARAAARKLTVLVPMALEPSVSAAPIAEQGGEGARNLTPVERLFRLLGRERRLMGYILLYASLAGLFSLTLPLGVQAIIGLISGGMLFQPVILLIGFVIVGTLANGGLQILQLSVVESVQQRVFARFAFELGAIIPRLRLDAVSDVDLPELMNRFFEIKTIQKTLSKILTDWTVAGLQVVFGLILLTFYHPFFALFGLLLVVSLGVFFRVTVPAGLETSLKESTYKYRVAHWIEELARNLHVLKFAGRSQLALDRMDQEVTGYLTYRQAHFRVLLRQSWAFVAFKTVVTGGVLVMGSLLVVNRSITLGQFVASELVIVTVLLSIEKLILGLADAYDLLTAVEKAGHLTDFATEGGLGIAMRPAETALGVSLTVRDLSFSYTAGHAPALGGVTFSVRPSEKVAVTGAAGAGESTLLKIIGGLYDSYVGAVAYDGVSLRELDRARVRELVGYCGQPIELFEGTIEENIAVGRPAVRTEDVLEALASVGLQEWVQQQPTGLQTELLGDGIGLPTQVARKLELARAIAGRPRLLLLDDFFDNLDPAAKRELLPFVLAHDAPWTVVVVSHDAQVLASCDRVVVLRDGAVASTGTFDELRTDPYFRDLAQV